MFPATSTQDLFDTAKSDFVRDLKEPYDFSSYSSINDIYQATDELQRKQSKTRTLRNLSRIKPYLDGLTQYSNIIELFCQVKPDVLCLIWVCS